MPGVAGVQATEKGNAEAEPIAVPLAKNATLTTAPPVAVAFAETVCGVLTERVAPLAGDVTATTGGVSPPPPPPPPGAVTVTTTSGEVVVVPTLSSAVAVRRNVPAAVGVHAAE